MLRVEIFHTLTHKTEEVHVRASPARIGRSGLSDILLDEPSVSSHHAVLMFDEDGVWFADVGSSNGSTVDGNAITPHLQAPVTEQTLLEVGPIQLRVYRGGDVRFDRRLPLGTEVSDELRTLMTQVDVTGVHDSGDATVAMDDSDPSTAIAGSAIVQLQYLRTLLDALEPARTAYLAAIEERVEALPAAARSKLLPQLAREFPELSRCPEYADFARRYGVDGLAFQELSPAEWAGKMTSAPIAGPNGEEITNARVLARVALLLQVFSQSLFELRRARHQGMRELGLGDPNEQWPTSGQDILTWLLDFRVDGEERISALVREFADIAVHQVGLVSAMREGMKAVVEELAPGQIEQRLVRERKKRSSPLDILPMTGFQLWDVFRAAYADLSDGERYSRIAFGARFARAYLSMTGRAPAPTVTPPRHGPVPRQTASEAAAIPLTRPGA